MGDAWRDRGNVPVDSDISRRIRKHIDPMFALRAYFKAEFFRRHRLNSMSRRQLILIADEAGERGYEHSREYRKMKLGDLVKYVSEIKESIH